MRSVFVIQERVRPRRWVPFAFSTSERKAVKIMKDRYQEYGLPVRIRMYGPIIWIAELPL